MQTGARATKVEEVANSGREFGSMTGTGGECSFLNNDAHIKKGEGRRNAVQIAGR